MGFEWYEEPGKEREETSHYTWEEFEDSGEDVDGMEIEIEIEDDDWIKEDLTIAYHF